MKDISDDRIEAYYTCKPMDFRVLQSLTLNQVTDLDGLVKQNMSISMLHSSSTEGGVLHLEFYNVRNCIVRQPQTSNIVLLLEIRPSNNIFISGPGYIVLDPEQEEKIRFECETFEAYVKIPF